MSRPLQTVLVLAGLLVAAAVVFGCGLGWGLPSRAADAYLFGERPPWTGKEILDPAGGWPDNPNLGADVDINPLAKGSEPLSLNETDAQRAAIVRRYRLYTHQPDEMITMRALASMRPSEGRLDPKLYQYGGLWIYPVGAAIRLAAAAGYLTLTPDPAWYLDHPAEFGKFYVVARLYTVAWAMIGVWAVFALTRKLTGGCAVAGAVAGLCVIVMPVVINMAHEAKPHLPGAAIMLLAVLAAMRYVESGRRGWWAATAVLCGAAFGMVLSAWPIFVVLPVMMILRRDGWQDVFTRTIFGGVIGAAVYLLTNPYILINLFVNRAVLQSNFGNSLAMYEVARLREGAVNAAWLVLEGTSPILAVFGTGGALWLGWRRHGPFQSPERKRRVRPADAGRTAMARGEDAVASLDTPRQPSAADRFAIAGEAGSGASRASRPDPALPLGALTPCEYWDVPACDGPALGWLLAAPVLVILVQFVALAAGKPGEYGRFAVLPDVALAIAAVTAVRRRIVQLVHGAIPMLLLVIMTGASGSEYLIGFARDASVNTSRTLVALQLRAYQQSGAQTMGVVAEPAPYDLPPVDLFRWQIYLLPPNVIAEEIKALDVLVRPWGTRPFAPSAAMASHRPDPPVLLDLDTKPISWADKRFDVQVRRRTP